MKDLVKTTKFYRKKKERRLRGKNVVLTKFKLNLDSKE